MAEEEVVRGLGLGEGSGEMVRVEERGREEEKDLGFLHQKLL
jgi:hypothetical protein